VNDVAFPASTFKMLPVDLPERSLAKKQKASHSAVDP
jgi:hypothetical protein